MKPFKHVNAKTINEAVTLLKEYKGKAKLIAGGTDLLGELKDRVLSTYPKVLVNIKTIPDMDYIKEDDGVLRIGALTKLRDIATSSVVKEYYDILVQAVRSVGSPQIRNMGTIGGNLCQDVRCWYYRASPWCGAPFICFLKGGKSCHALTGENQYHSIFGASRVASPPCFSNCPATVDIPSYLSKVREGDLREAAKVLLNANPFPSITGRVCPHFCEQECNRGEFDESVSIRSVERFMGDYILENANEVIKLPKTDTGKSVAIVGSGPAGLSAAYYLRMSGHRVTVFDQMEEPGGMLTYGIPAYRLPKYLVRRVVKTIENTGIEFKLKVDVGKDVTVEDLKKDFDSIFFATGAWRPLSIGLEGEELLISGLQFLTNVNLVGLREAPGRKVLVVGGGNVAVDVAITASRCGAEEVTLVCLESRGEMPALKSEIEQAIEEGVKLMPSRGPYRVLKADGKVSGIELVQCTSVFDDEGRFAPTFDYSIKERVQADQIIMAVGQRPDLSFIDPEWLLKVERGLIVVDRATQGTNIPGVFAGGEVTSGPATVPEAIAAGRRAAVAMDLYLRGGGRAEDIGEKTVKSFLKFNSEYLKRTSRIKMPKLSKSERGVVFEDALGLDLSEIETEANRCFNCGCVAVNSSDMAVVLTALDAKIKVTGPRGVRIIETQDFFDSLGSVLEADEMVTEVQVPRPPDGAKQTFLKFRLRKAIDFAVVSIASIITVGDGLCEDARIVLGAVAPTPTRATEAEQTIKGNAINVETAESVAEAALIGAVPLSMNAWKVEITKTLVRRAILS